MHKLKWNRVIGLRVDDDFMNVILKAADKKKMPYSALIRTLSYEQAVNIIKGDKHD